MSSFKKDGTVTLLICLFILVGHNSLVLFCWYLVEHLKVVIVMDIIIFDMNILQDSRDWNIGEVDVVSTY